MKTGGGDWFKIVRGAMCGAAASCFTLNQSGKIVRGYSETTASVRGLQARTSTSITLAAAETEHVYAANEFKGRVHLKSKSAALSERSSHSCADLIW